MSRSPLAYPLNRAADTDAGGAADLQTDIMRFMAILSMCLLAIFALVQSIPLAPVEAVEPPDAVVTEKSSTVPVPAPPAAPTPAVEVTPDSPVVLTKPKWTPEFTPATVVVKETPPVEKAPLAAQPVPVPETPQEAGFTLRFASDGALMRAVAAHQVGLYAIEQGRARRMTVSDSRISFWDASTPNTFHEMETGTVPQSVIDALGRSGADTGVVSWGVTLPGRMKAQLDTLLHEHRGGSLIISADGNIHWEAS